VFYFGIGANTNAWYSDYSGNDINNNNSSLNLMISNPLGLSNQIVAKLEGKYLDKRQKPSQNIKIHTGTQYYIHIERLSSIKASLSVFTDTAKSIHAPGSPVGCDLNSKIGDLKYVQFGTSTMAGWSRTANVIVDNLNIYDSLGTGNPTTGIVLNTVNELFNVYPNPIINILNISLPESEKGSKVKIISSTGKVMYNKVLKTSNEVINMERFPKGIYYIIIENIANIYSTKVIKI